MNASHTTALSLDAFNNRCRTIARSGTERRASIQQLLASAVILSHAQQAGHAMQRALSALLSIRAEYESAARYASRHGYKATLKEGSVTVAYDGKTQCAAFADLYADAWDVRPAVEKDAAGKPTAKERAAKIATALSRHSAACANVAQRRAMLDALAAALVNDHAELAAALADRLSAGINAALAAAEQSSAAVAVAVESAAPIAAAPAKPAKPIRATIAQQLTAATATATH